MKKSDPKLAQDDLFQGLKDSLLNLDPVAWAEANLTLDGKPFRLHGNGYKPFADIYRSIALSAWNKSSKKFCILKGRQVGMSTAAAILELYFMNCGLFGFNGRPPIRIAHVFPQLEMAYKFSKQKFNALISGSRLVDNPRKPGTKIGFLQTRLDGSSPTNDSLQYKQFEGGNTAVFESTGLQADRLRGITVDCLFADEIQLISRASIGSLTKALTAAQYGAQNNGMQVYFGTPLRKGSGFWEMWNETNQQYYHLGCNECYKDFPLYAPTINFMDIWIDDDLPADHKSHGFIVKCTHCGAQQDKREAAERGKWISYNPKGNDIGYHISQLFIPFFDRKKIISEMPENSAINSEKIWQNEILGNFFSGDSSPITAEQIEEACADYGRKFSTSIMPSDNKRVYLGADWGLKIDSDSSSEDDLKKQVGQSYSCVVILQTEGPNILSIQYAARLKKNDYQYKKDIIEQLFRQYSVNLACGDIGYSQDLTETLQRQFGNRFLATQASSRVNGYIKYRDDYFPNTIVFEKNYLFSELFDMMKKGKIRFPFGDWEQVSWLISHCSSHDIKVITDRSGETSMNFCKGRTVDDGFCALLNAVLAWKCDTSKFFTIKHPNNLIDPVQSKGIPAILAHMPIFNR